MPVLADSRLEVRLNLLGLTLDRFKSWSIDSAYLVSTDGFSFDLYDPQLAPDQALELQPCELFVGGVSQLLGRIDRTRMGHDGKVVTCDGRDYISDLVECNADPNVRFPENTQLDEALLKLMGPCGIDSITDFENILFSELKTGKKIQHTKRRRRKRKLQDYKPRPGEGIFEICNRLVARQGSTIQPSDVRTEVVIDAPNYQQTPICTLLRSSDPRQSVSNNIISSEAERDFSRFPTFVIFAATGATAPGKPTQGLRPAFFNMKTLADSFSSELGRILTAAVAPDRPERVDPGYPASLYRLLYHRDQDARSSEDLFDGAKRAIAERLKDTLAYRCTVKGHTDPQTGAIYTVNTMANVSDDVCRVNEPLWIAKRTLRYSESQGAMTDLELWRPESFQIFDDGE